MAAQPRAIQSTAPQLYMCIGLAINAPYIIGRCAATWDTMLWHGPSRAPVQNVIGLSNDTILQNVPNNSMGSIETT